VRDRRKTGQCSHPLIHHWRLNVQTAHRELWPWSGFFRIFSGSKSGLLIALVDVRFVIQTALDQEKKQ
jgi:hypothetical protein